MGIEIQGSGVGVSGFGLMVWGLPIDRRMSLSVSPGCTLVWVLGFGGWIFGVWVLGSGFWILGLGLVYGLKHAFSVLGLEGASA